MSRFRKIVPVVLLSLLASACSDGQSSSSDGALGTNGTGSAGAGGSTGGATTGGTGGSSATIDRTCDTAASPSEAYTQCEATNYAMVSQAPAEQAANPDFTSRLQTQSTTNMNALLARDVADSSWLGAPSGNTTQTPLCATYAEPCAGDPYRYPEATGPDGDAFYTSEAEVVPVVFYDDGCARLSGRVWAPKGSKAGDALPGVVIENGSVEAPETVYWWAAQLLVRAGYVVLTEDPRGQGRSDLQTPTGGQGSNENAVVFTSGLVNAIDFFRSSSVQPYPHNITCKGTYPTAVTAYNPFLDRIDPARLGIAGHSAGATGVLNVQAYGAPGAEAWPGKIDTTNPVKVAVAWDSTTNPNITGGGVSTLPGVADATAATATPPILYPHVPIMEMQSEYGLAPAPYAQAPDPLSHEVDYLAWETAGIPVFQFTIRGSSHYEFSLLPDFPATSWCADTATGACSPGWGNTMAQHYTLAWLDRWLKRSGESGYADADARLLDDAGPQGANKMSYHFHSVRDFSGRDGTRHSCTNIRGGCTDQ